MDGIRNLASFIIALLFIPLFANAEQIATAEIKYSEQLEVKSYHANHGLRAVINVAARKLRLYDHEKLVKSYPIAVGLSAYRTPLGTREMTQIVWNPWWNPPKTSAWARNAKDTPPGPHNPLGPVKMRLGGTILIHGTNKPDSVGQAASHGCIRMYSEQALELARYIQERIMLDINPATYENYAKQNRRSFYVNLAQTVPVSTLYEIAEIEDGVLHVYKDVYSRVGDKVSHVKNLLVNSGYQLEKLDLRSLSGSIQRAKNGVDLVFPIDRILMARGDGIKVAEGSRLSYLRTY